MNAFSHGSRLVGQIKQISYICLLEKNIGKPQCTDVCKGAFTGYLEESLSGPYVVPIVEVTWEHKNLSKLEELHPH